MQSKLKACTFAGGLLLLLGAVSCNKENDSVQMPDDLVIEHGVITASVDNTDAATKANLDDDYLFTWSVGDKIVMFSNNQINGTLECKEVDGSGNATFRGDVSQFSLSGVDFYYLANQEAYSSQPSFDLSVQNGNKSGLVGSLFLKSKSSVSLKKVEDSSKNEYIIDGTGVEMDGTPLIPILEIRNLAEPLRRSGMLDDLTGVRATSLRIENLKNLMTIDLKTGKVTASMKPDNNFTVVSAYEASNVFYMAVLPQVANDLKMQINYTGTDIKSLLIQNLDWTIGEDGSFYSDMATKEGLTFGSISSKSGYGGNTVGGGELADGLNSKGGYSGNTAGDADDVDGGQKSGYTGNEAVQN